MFTALLVERWYVVEHGVRPVVHFESVKVPEQHGLPEAFPIAVRVPPRLPRRPRRRLIARVKGRNGREETVG